MALVESEVAFQDAVMSWSLGCTTSSKGRTLFSFSTLAFALGSLQNQIIDSQLSELAAKIHGGDTNVGNTANIRRLHFEACTFWMADMKNSGGVHRPVRACTQMAVCWETEQVRVTENVGSPACHIGQISSLRIT